MPGEHSIAADNVPPEQRAELDRAVELERQAATEELERVAAGLTAETVRRELEASVDGAPDKPESDAGAHVDRALNLLELNGYNAIRHEVRAALGALAAIPPEALEAAWVHAGNLRERVRLGDDPRRDEALRGADIDLATLKLARHVIRDLKTLDERQAARDRIAL